MRALITRPGVPGSAEVAEVPGPAESEGPILVRSLAVGLCATDADIVAGLLGRAPEGSAHLVLGHEGLGRVERSAAPGFEPGDLVVGFVRRPDPEPCPACAAGEWDMCLNGRYTSHGITARHGYARDRWRSAPDALIRVPPSIARVGALVEPASVVAKAWEQIERIGRRAHFGPRTVLIAGAGTIGLLAALASVRRGLDVHVFDLVADGPKPRLVAALGAVYHAEPLAGTALSPDILFECTGDARAIADLLALGGPAGITCLMGMSPEPGVLPLDVAAFNRRMVRGNGVVFGSVNANRRHFEQAATHLATADPAWLAALISRRVALEDFADGLRRRPDDVKVLIDLDG